MSEKLSTILYGGHQEFCQHLKVKALKKNKGLKTYQELIRNKGLDNYIEEGKALFQLIQLHRNQQLDLSENISWLNDLTPYSRALEIHFNIFKNVCLTFVNDTNRQALEDSINQINIIGSVFLQEIDFNLNIVEDEVHTIANFNSETKKFYLNTSSKRAKFCKFFGPFTTHAIIFARIKYNNTLTTPFPFLIQFRSLQDFSLQKGIKEVQLGSTVVPTLQREAAYEFQNLEIGSENLLLNRYLDLKDQLNIYGDDMTIDYQTKLCLLQQQSEDIKKSIREGLKIAFLALRFTNVRSLPTKMALGGLKLSELEFNYIKAEVLEIIVELLMLQMAAIEIRKFINENITYSQNSFDTLNEMFVFVDALEILVNDKCFKVLNTLRKRVGAMGFVRFPGILLLCKNMLRNAMSTEAVKDVRYLKLADFLVQTNLERKGTFMQIYTPLLSERKENNVFSMASNFEKDPLLLSWFLGKKALHLKDQLSNMDIFQVSQDYNQLANSLTNFNDINNLCDTFLSYLTQSIAQNYLETYLDIDNDKLMHTIVLAYNQAVLLKDLPYIVQEEGRVLKEGTSQNLKTSLENNYETLLKLTDLIMKSLGLDDEIVQPYEYAIPENLLKVDDYKDIESNSKIQEIGRSLFHSLNKNMSPKL